MRPVGVPLQTLLRADAVTVDAKGEGDHLVLVVDPAIKLQVERVEDKGGKLLRVTFETEAINVRDPDRKVRLNAQAWDVVRDHLGERVAGGHHRRVLVAAPAQRAGQAGGNRPRLWALRGGHL